MHAYADDAAYEAYALVLKVPDWNALITVQQPRPCPEPLAVVISPESELFLHKIDSPSTLT